MKVVNVSARVEQGEHHEYGKVVLTLDSGAEIEFLIGASTIYQDAVNMEIDADLTTDDPSLRIHLNDRLIVDTAMTPAPEIDDLRDLPDEADEDDEPE